MTVSISRFARYFLLVFSFVFAFGLATAPEAVAQDKEKTEETSDDEGPRTAWEQVKEGGIWMVFLGILSMITVALYVYNFIQLTQGKFGPVELKNAVMEHMTACRVRSAIEVSQTSSSYLGRMLADTLPQIDATQPEDLGRDRVEDAMADFTINENRGYMTWISYFSVVAQTAPMLGLLGTVAGMMGAFNTLAESGNADPKDLAGDIGKALITTLTGLCIAIPAVFGYFFFKNKLNKLVADCHTAEHQMIEASVVAVNADSMLAKVPEGLQAG